MPNGKNTLAAAAALKKKGFMVAKLKSPPLVAKIAPLDEAMAQMIATEATDELMSPHEAYTFGVGSSDWAFSPPATCYTASSSTYPAWGANEHQEQDLTAQLIKQNTRIAALEGAFNQLKGEVITRLLKLDEVMEELPSAVKVDDMANHLASLTASLVTLQMGDIVGLVDQLDQLQVQLTNVKDAFKTHDHTFYVQEEVSVGTAMITYPPSNSWHLP
jgi:hypothetical protein